MKRISLTLPLLVAVLCLVAAGCGKGNHQTVSGTVTMDGNPLTEANVAFESMDRAIQIGGDTTRSDAQGKFEIKADKQKAGLKPGKFSVYVSKWVDKKTKQAPPPEDAEMLKASNTLINVVPFKYSNREETPLITVEIKPGKNEGIKIELKSK